MANRNDKDNTGRTVAIVGGGALLLLLLLGGKGWGLGGKGGKGQGNGDPGAAPGSTGRTPCRVRIDADGIQVDGAPTDIATMTERCRAAGSAEVRATGAAITGVIGEVIDTLRAGGIQVWASPEVWDSSGYRPTRRSR